MSLNFAYFPFVNRQTQLKDLEQYYRAFRYRYDPAQVLNMHRYRLDSGIAYPTDDKHDSRGLM